ncbi:MAG TPA: tetratricopeptide repeat protein, partial [Phycisphaerae bacterium]|nr:tetratricopeptide repeat protein [Phycisphaerae bacterium]
IIAWWKTGRIALRDLLPLVPWFIAALAIAPLTNSMEKTNGPEFHFTFAQHMIIMGKDLWFYVLKFIWPHPLLEIYPRWDVANFSALDWLFPITALAVPVVLWSLRKKIGRGPAAAVAFYAATLFPALGFLAFYGSIMTFVTDHYFYLPIIGLIVLIVEPIVRFLNRITAPKIAQASEPTVKSHKRPLSIGLIACFSLALLIPLGVVSFAQSTLYAPPVGIWLNVLKYNPGSWIAQEQAGAYYYDVGDDAGASVYLQKAFAATRGKESSVDVNLGDLYSDQFNHDPSTAARYYGLALAVDPYQPGVIIKLVHCYEAMGNFPQASFDLQKGLAEYPQSAALHFEFGYLLALADKYALAADQFLQVIKFEPENALGTYNLALLLEHLNKVQDAQTYYRRALQISPNFSLGHYDYGRFLLAQNRPADAIVELEKAIQISRQEKSMVLEAKSLTVLARAYDALKSSQEAVQTRAQIKQLGFPVIATPMPISPLLPNG